MALTTYEKLDKAAVERQGESWWSCDDPDCGNEVQVQAVVVPKACTNCGATDQLGDRFCGNCGHKFVAPVPEGWRTSDPNDDPHQGAAQFCPEHATAVYVPEIDNPGSLADNPPTVMSDE